MKNWYKKLEEIWFTSVPEKLRFVLVGGFNTSCSYLLFLLILLVFRYQITLILSYALGINISIFTMRYFVFRAKGKILPQYIKAGTSYLMIIPTNYLFLYIFTDVLKIEVRLSQALFTIISAITIYYLHKNVNFKSK